MLSYECFHFLVLPPAQTSLPTSLAFNRLCEYCPSCDAPITLPTLLSVYFICNFWRNYIHNAAWTPFYKVMDSVTTYITCILGGSNPSWSHAGVPNACRRKHKDYLRPHDYNAKKKSRYVWCGFIVINYVLALLLRKEMCQEFKNKHFG